MSEMVERLARVLAKQRCWEWMRLPEEEREYLRKSAYALIEALREPTVEMGHAGADVSRHLNYGIWEIYQAMIDAALGGRHEEPQSFRINGWDLT